MEDAPSISVSLIEPVVRSLGDDLPGLAALLARFDLDAQRLADPAARVSAIALS